MREVSTTMPAMQNQDHSSKHRRGKKRQLKLGRMKTQIYAFMAIWVTRDASYNTYCSKNTDLNKQKHFIIKDFQWSYFKRHECRSIAIWRSQKDSIMAELQRERTRHIIFSPGCDCYCKISLSLVCCSPMIGWTIGSLKNSSQENTNRIHFFFWVRHEVSWAIMCRRKVSLRHKTSN